MSPEGRPDGLTDFTLPDAGPDIFRNMQFGTEKLLAGEKSNVTLHLEANTDALSLPLAVPP